MIKYFINRYTLIAAILTLLLALAWTNRNKFLPFLPIAISSRIRSYVPLSTFEEAAEGGFSTSNFDLRSNIAGDSRAGLDEASLTEIRRLMERHAIGFDEARHVRHVEILKKNGIDQFGFPMDPKAITSLS